METLSWLCLFLPLAGVVVLALAVNRISREAASWLGTAAAFGSFLCAAIVFFNILGEGESRRSHVYTLYTWAGSSLPSTLRVPLAIQVDQLAVFEMLIVSGVGALIVMYSIGYMHGDPKQRRFFAYLDLFLFSMLLLVMASNFVLLLAGWGLVGLSSYLLIGFWHEQRAPVEAAKKAFVMNAIGDVGIAIAIFFMARDLGTTDYHQVFTHAHTVWPKGSSDANWVALALLVGAVAKSAQIPLHTWLPDAMEGPTPVSALIHAATMVTAGVYLIARTHVLFENAPDVQNTVAVIGVATLLMAGVIALVQTDIKRIIAYSTMSQIGYMFAAVGVGAYSEGMFHLLTHAFFKALLFLGAGIVIHALANEQDVRRMGGLSKVMPRTTILMWIGTIALIGFWPLSKDAILEGSLASSSSAGWIVYVGGLIGAAFTGVYATRLMRLVFYGDMSQFAREHLHEGHGEAPWTMFWPVCVLAAGAILAGFLDVGFGTTNHIGEFLAGTAPSIEATVPQDILTTALAWGLGGAGGLLVWWLYADENRVVAVRQRFLTVVMIAEAKFGWDELYYNIGYRPAVWLAVTFDRVGERWIVGGSIWVARTTVETIARATALAQSGIVRQYATVLAGGAAIVAVYFLGKASL
jgi:NADH-quinone oxidoreductase subunit L